MGVTGPIPRRDDERVRRNIPNNPTETIAAIGPVEIPELGDVSFLGETHPLVTEMYDSIKDSAAIRFYEPTDWQYARLTLYLLNQELIVSQHQRKPAAAMKVASLNQMLSSLLLTEGDRRRVRLEIERAPAAPAEGAVLSFVDALKQKLEAATRNGS